MDDILVHYGVLGMKWGVRKEYESVGKTKKVTSRADVNKKFNGKNNDQSQINKKHPKQGTVDQYKSLYDEQLNALRNAYKNSKDKRGNITFENKEALLSTLRNAESTISLHSGESNNPGAVKTGVERKHWSEALEQIGLDTSVSMYDLGKKILDSKDKEATEKLYDEAIKYLAAYQAFQQMGNYNWLPSEVEEREEKEREIEEISSMEKELEKAGLSGIFKVSKSYNVSGESIIAYTAIIGDKSYRFKKGDIKKMQKFALENDLFSNDYRTSSKSKTREKNIDTSGGAKKVTKRGTLDISDKERSDKTSASRASMEDQAKKNKEMLDALIKARKRTQAAIKQDAAKKRLSHMDGENEYMDDILVHYGVLGMKWGVRRYQNKDGSLTSLGKQRIGQEYSKASNKLRKLDSKLVKRNEKRDKAYSKYTKAEAKANKKRGAFMSGVYNPAQDKADKAYHKYYKASNKASKSRKKATKWYKAMEKTFKGIELTSVSQADIDLGKAYAQMLWEEARK